MTYTNPDALVDTGWLADHLDDPAVRIVEVDEETALYEKNHIPEATSWSWSEDLHHPTRRDYLDQEGFSELLSQAGVGARVGHPRAVTHTHRGRQQRHGREHNAPLT